MIVHLSYTDPARPRVYTACGLERKRRTGIAVANAHEVHVGPRLPLGCQGMHRGTGSPECPRDVHHHHDEQCPRDAPEPTQPKPEDCTCKPCLDAHLDHAMGLCERLERLGPEGVEIEGKLLRWEFMAISPDGQVVPGVNGDLQVAARNGYLVIGRGEVMDPQKRQSLVAEVKRRRAEHRQKGCCSTRSCGSSVPGKNEEEEGRSWLVWEK